MGKKAGRAGRAGSEPAIFANPMYQQQTMVESLQTNRDDAMKIHLISNVGVVIDYMIQNMIYLTFILFIEYLINLEVHNLACFYSKRVRFERLGTEGLKMVLKWTANHEV